MDRESIAARSSAGRSVRRSGHEIRPQTNALINHDSVLIILAVDRVRIVRGHDLHDGVRVRLLFGSRAASDSRLHQRDRVSGNPRWSVRRHQDHQPHRPASQLQFGSLFRLEEVSGRRYGGSDHAAHWRHVRAGNAEFLAVAERARTGGLVVAAVAPRPGRGRERRVQHDPSESESGPSVQRCRPLQAPDAPETLPETAAHHLRHDDVPEAVRSSRVQLLRGAHLPRHVRRNEPARCGRGRRLRAARGRHHVRTAHRYGRPLTAAHHQQRTHDSSSGVVRHLHLLPGRHAQRTDAFFATGHHRQIGLDPSTVRAHLHRRLPDRRRAHRMALHWRTVPARVPVRRSGNDHVLQLHLLLRQRQNVRRSGSVARPARRFLDLRFNLNFRIDLRSDLRAGNQRPRSRRNGNQVAADLALITSFKSDNKTAQ